MTNTKDSLCPPQWQRRRLENVADVCGGGTPSTAVLEYWGGDINWITPTEVGRTKYIDNSKRKLTRQGLSNSSATLLPIGTLLMTTRASIGELAILKVEAATNQGFQSLVVKPGTSVEFLYYLMQSKKGELIRNASGSTFLEISPARVKSLSVCTPPLEEQKAIAEVLSDVDELIAQTERLIAKKEAIKTGLMQELLRPKEGWDNAKIGELGTTYGGLSGKSKKDFVSGTHRYVPFMNVMANTIVNIDNLEYVRIGIHEKQNLVKAGDLLFNGSSETPEELGMCSLMYQDVSDLYLNSFCFGFSLNNPKKIDALFLTYLFRSNYGRALIYSSAQGATRYNLSKRNFLGLSISFPPIKEQQAIVEVLSEVDEELKLMRDLSFKYEQLKSAMNTQLLTGKTRLV